MTPPQKCQILDPLLPMSPLLTFFIIHRPQPPAPYVTRHKSQISALIEDFKK